MDVNKDKKVILLRDDIKFLDGKKWKKRTCIIRKVNLSNHVEDLLIIELYKKISKPTADQLAFDPMLEFDKQYLILKTSFELNSRTYFGSRLSSKKYSLKNENMFSILSESRIYMFCAVTSNPFLKWYQVITENMGPEYQYEAFLSDNSSIKSEKVTVYLRDKHLSLSNTKNSSLSILKHWTLDQLENIMCLDNKTLILQINAAKESTKSFFMTSESCTQIYARVKDLIDNLSKATSGQHHETAKSYEKANNKASLVRRFMQKQKFKCNTPNIPHRSERDREPLADFNNSYSSFSLHHEETKSAKPKIYIRHEDSSSNESLNSVYSAIESPSRFKRKILQRKFSHPIEATHHVRSSHSVHRYPTIRIQSVINIMPDSENLRSARSRSAKAERRHSTDRNFQEMRVCEAPKIERSSSKLSVYFKKISSSLKNLNNGKEKAKDKEMKPTFYVQPEVSYNPNTKKSSSFKANAMMETHTKDYKKVLSKQFSEKIERNLVDNTSEARKRERMRVNQMNSRANSRVSMMHEGRLPVPQIVVPNTLPPRAEKHEYSDLEFNPPDSPNNHSTFKPNDLLALKQSNSVFNNIKLHKSPRASIDNLMMPPVNPLQVKRKESVIYDEPIIKPKKGNEKHFNKMLTELNRVYEDSSSYLSTSSSLTYANIEKIRAHAHGSNDLMRQYPCKPLETTYENEYSYIDFEGSIALSKTAKQHQQSRELLN